MPVFYRVYAPGAVEHASPGQVSCPKCDARAPAQTRACGRCGYPFLEDERLRRRPGRRGLALAGGALAGIVLVVALLTRGGDETREEVVTRAAPEVLSSHPLSTRAAERLLEARFVALRDDDSAGARCSERRPEPAHAVRRCRVRYPNGTERTVIVVMNARGRELLVEP